MATPVENPTVERAGASNASRKLREYMRRRLRQFAKVVAGLMVCVGLFAIWWWTSLIGLPDIGDPFDVAALRRLTIPDDRNAVTFLRQAQAKLTPLPELPPSLKGQAPPIGWSKLDPKLRDWVDANRSALGLYKRAADQPDALSPTFDDSFWWHRERVLGPGGLIWLALLEGGRLAESGDSAGAWECYSATLCILTHLQRRSNTTLHHFANIVNTALTRRIADWASDPNTTVPQLRRALEDVVKTKPQPEWTENALKLDYINTMQIIDLQSNQSINMRYDEDISYRYGEYQIPADLAPYVYGAQRFLRREPERSRRVLRLLYANWLAHVAVPELRLKKPAVIASFSSGHRNSTTLPLYPMSPQAPAGARALSSDGVASWLVTSIDAKRFMGWGFWLSARNQELRGYRQLVVSLATELYRREHGTLPPSDDALVGTYLQTLPDDASADAGDGTAPTVSDNRGQP